MKFIDWLFDNKPYTEPTPERKAELYKEFREATPGKLIEVTEDEIHWITTQEFKDSPLNGRAKP